MDNMTETDKALLLSLTEEAYARATGAAGKPFHPGKLVWREQWIANKLHGIPWYKVTNTLHELLNREYEIYAEYWEQSVSKWMEWMEGYLRWRKSESRRLRKANAAGENQHELGPREFTFTYTDSWYEDDTDAQNAMRCAVEKLTRYYKNEIIEFHAVGEFTRAGRAHVHGWYHLAGGRKITDKNFKRAWPHWNPKRKLGKGFEGGHHASVSRVSDFYGYSEKHLEEAWLDIHINNGSQEVVVPSLPEEGSPSPHGGSPSDSSQVQ